MCSTTQIIVKVPQINPRITKGLTELVWSGQTRDIMFNSYMRKQRGPCQSQLNPQYETASGMALTKHIATLTCPRDLDPPSIPSEPFGHRPLWFNSRNGHVATLDMLVGPVTRFHLLAGLLNSPNGYAVTRYGPTVEILRTSGFSKLGGTMTTHCIGADQE
jgi:hypothetical protein